MLFSMCESVIDFVKAKKKQLWRAAFSSESNFKCLKTLKN